MSKQTKNGRTVTVKTHTRRIGGGKQKPRSIPRSSRRAAERSTPLREFLAQATTDRADLAEIIVKGKFAALALAVSVGGYMVLYGALAPMYPGAGGWLRALVPLAVEMLAGYAAHWAIGSKRAGLALLAVLVILGCGWTEIDAARTAPEVAKRERVAHVLEQSAAQPADVKLQDADPGEGRQAKLTREKNQAAALDIAKQDRADAKAARQQMLANAQATTDGEGRLALWLAILGAIGSACYLPMLEGFLRALVSRRQ